MLCLSGFELYPRWVPLVLLCNLSKYVIYLFQSSLENFIWSYVVNCKYDQVIALLTRELHSFGFPWSTSSGILNYLCPFHIHHLFQTYKTVRSSPSSTMNLLIDDTQIKAKILSGDHAFWFCVPKLCNNSP